MSRQDHTMDPELVLLPLGGIGEIGMNCYLYGLGTRRHRTWMMVDLGITFPGPAEPGIDVIYPDLAFIEEERGNLAGLVLTHAHEDHFGAVNDLLPHLGCPVFATPFTATLLKAKRAERVGGTDIDLREIAMGSRFNIGPFDVELVTMAHSIPEPNALLIRTHPARVFHSGDWKIDPDPIAGPPMDAAKVEAFGKEGCDVLVCDSTNAIREGVSPSEADVAKTLRSLVGEAKGRVAVTTFASNVARILSVAEAARAADRELVVVGRAMHRVILAAQETGYIDPSYRFLSDEDYGYLPRDKVVALCTGSQGESRAALSRIASDDHPKVSLAPGDQVIFSARTIPGNERVVGRVQNNLADLGVTVITDRDALVHVSGHPRTGELEQLYRLLRPKAVIPMHGEPTHLEAHAAFAEAQGVPDVLSIRNGDVARLAPGPLEIVDDAPSGRLYRDGRLVVDGEDGTLRARRKLSYVGCVAVAVTMTHQGELAAEIDAAVQGLPPVDGQDVQFLDVVRDAAEEVVESLPRPRRRDRELVREAVRRAVRAAVGERWGKKPICNVLVTVV